jgi:hypothetical protein
MAVGRGGVSGSNRGQKGTVYKQPGTEVDFPSQAGGRQVSRAGVNKGEVHVQNSCNLYCMNDE